MRTARTDIAKVIAQRTHTSGGTQDLAKEIAAYLLAENRAYELDSLMRDVMALREEEGVVEATAESAHELGADVQREMRDIVHQLFPSAKKIDVSSRLEADIIGGVRLHFANSQLDMSIRSKLDTFKRLTEGIN